MSRSDILSSPRVSHSQLSSISSIPLRNRLVQVNLSRRNHKRSFFSIVCSSNSDSDDFVTRVLKDNPCQIEPRFLVGDKFYTLKEKENLNKSSNVGILQIAKRVFEKLKTKGGFERDGVGEEKGGSLGPVYLKDILREYKGKLYVPEDVFKANLSEEEEFDRNLEELPKLGFDDLMNVLECDKVKMLTSKAVNGIANFYEYRDFIVELKDIPGEKSLQRRKWAIKLDGNQAHEVLKQYTGPQCEIERSNTMSYVGTPEYPHPVASSISSRMIVELGVLTALMVSAAAVVGGFLASAVFTVTTFLYGVAVYVVLPLARPIFKLTLGLISGILERIWDNLIDIFSDGGFFSKLNQLYTFGGVSASLEMAKPIMLVFFTMVLLIRFTLSRRPKNFKKWDIWQGIEFGQSKAQARVDGSTGVSFNDVAGIEEAVEELQELVRYLKNPELFDKMGIKPPHGVLLEGPPGCGKTLVAKAIAGEAGVPFYQMAGSEFVEVLVGVGSARIRDLFKRAKVNKPSVIFIDEIDALATSRRQGIFSGSTDNLYSAATQERETTLNQLLIELDGFDTGKGVIFLGATNRRDLLDPALLRPGRFDRKIRIRAPGAKGRLDILKVHARKVKMSPTVDLSTYAQNLPDMDDAVDRLTVGPKRVGTELGHQGQCRRATTEVGTAMTSHLLRRYENADVELSERISIIPRGQTLSQIVFHRLGDESYKFERRPQLLHRLQVLLGGRAAEEVIYGRDTSKASVSYLADASWLARKILTVWNLDNTMTIHGEPPPWRKKMRFVGPRLDFEGSLYDDYDLIEPPINFNLDDEVAQRTEELLRDMYERTVSLLRKHHVALLKTVKVSISLLHMHLFISISFEKPYYIQSLPNPVMQVLVDQKEISGEQIEYIIDRYPAETPTSLLLKEENPGSLPFFGVEQGQSLEFSLVTANGEIGQ
ncbi:hypothetical protein GIB67_042235 [Kingdonia uniflora]|uniref:AAA+ ATPase domain-containing protein n=1 Tax=Kingdonia uniflora TaxID=39325 RepID=A0A7J7LE51_9MAGN|nr:hypothetical protein GIB67_042235 [Kingdonia uniflora]